MRKIFRPYSLDRQLLLPPDLRAWFPEGHVALYVSDVVDALDLAAITRVYEEAEPAADALRAVALYIPPDRQHRYPSHHQLPGSLLVPRAGILLALIATLASAALRAQDSASASLPHLRHGLWLSVGLGYGRLDFSCGGGTDPWDPTPPAETCPEAGRARSTLGFLRAGYALTQQVLLSVSVDAWRRVGTSEGAVDLGVAIRGYPVRSRGLFAEAGVGRSEFRNHVADGPDEVARGVGLVAGFGWDVRVDTNMSLSPVVLLHYGYQGDTGMPTVLHFPDGSRFALRTRVHETLVTFGLAVTFH